jgi:hypothetical protein
MHHFYCPLLSITYPFQGFHNIALRKAAGTGMATPEYMMSHNGKGVCFEYQSLNELNCFL